MSLLVPLQHLHNIPIKYIFDQLGTVIAEICVILCKCADTCCFRVVMCIIQGEGWGIC